MTLRTAPLSSRLSSSFALSKGIGQLRPEASTSASQAIAVRVMIISAKSMQDTQRNLALASHPNTRLQ